MLKDWAFFIATSIVELTIFIKNPAKSNLPAILIAYNNYQIQQHKNM